MSKNTWTLAAVLAVAAFLLFIATKRNVDQAAVVETPATVEEPATAPPSDRDTNTIIRDGLGAPRFD